MPKKPLDPNLILEPEVPTTPSKGGWAPVAAAATRGVSGLIGTGGPIGAIASGGGEVLAQLIEALGGVSGPQTIPQRLGRIGTEAAVGAVPFGRVAKSGEALYNLLRGGALAGVGESGRELVSEGEIDPLRVGASAALGGASAAGAQRLFDFFGARAPQAVQPEIVPTSQTVRAPKPRPITPKSTVQAPVPPPAPAPNLPTPFEAPGAVPGGFDPAQFDDIMGVGGRSVPYNAPAGLSRSAQRAEQSAQRQQDQAWAQEARNLNAAEKAEDEIARRASIEAARREAGVEPQAPTFSESLSAPTAEGGRTSMSTRFAVPKPDEPDEISALADALGVPRAQVGPNKGVQRQVPVDPEAALIGNAEEVVDEAGDFGQLILNQGQPFRSRVDASGANYRDIKSALGAGEAVPEAARRAAGRGLQREGQAVGLPPRGPIPADAPGQIVPEGETPDWVQQELGIVDRLRKLISEQSSGGTLTDPGSGKGFAYPEIATTLASASLGGLAGATMDPFGNPIMSGLAGAFGGAALPHLPALARGGVGAAQNVLEKGRESFGNLDDARETVLSALERIPNIQRFNLLSSPTGLPTNAIAGPYGSVVMGSLEKGLSGDARGWDALKNIGNPFKFLREMHTRENADEALDLVRKGELGRAEFAETADPNWIDDATKFPGWYMTMGDTTGKRGLMEAGFSELEARKMGLTSEPDSYMRWLAHLGAGRTGDDAKSRIGNIALNTMLPFRRTPANIVEQGVDRLPVVGAGLQLMNKGNVNLRELGAQQLLGTGTMGLGYAAGANIEDPTVAREARRVLSNLGGQYSLPSSLGFAAGQSVQKGQSGKQFARDATRELFPIPATRPIEENIGALGNLFLGESGDEVEVPRGMKPAFWREYMEEDSQPVTNLPTLPTFRNRGR